MDLLHEQRRHDLERASRPGSDRRLLSPTVLHIVTASDDATSRVWNATTGEEIACLLGHKGKVTSALFSPNGDRVVTTSDDRTARIWDVTTGTEITRIASSCLLPRLRPVLARYFLVAVKHSADSAPPPSTLPQIFLQMHPHMRVVEKRGSAPLDGRFKKTLFVAIGMRISATTQTAVIIPTNS
jgi:hypothetical protein